MASLVVAWLAWKVLWSIRSCLRGAPDCIVLLKTSQKHQPVMHILSIHTLFYIRFLGTRDGLLLLLLFRRPLSGWKIDRIKSHLFCIHPLFRSSSIASAENKNHSKNERKQRRHINGRPSACMIAWTECRRHGALLDHPLPFQIPIVWRQHLSPINFLAPAFSLKTICSCRTFGCTAFQGEWPLSRERVCRIMELFFWILSYFNAGLVSLHFIFPTQQNITGNI